jgi:hypothetical protein
MPKPKRIQRPIDMSAKALADFVEVQRRRECGVREDFRQVAVRQGWTVTEGPVRMDEGSR